MSPPVGHHTVSPRAASALAVLFLVSTMVAISSWSRGAPQEQPSPPIPPERVRVGLVLIEVVVRDRKDQAITGLGREQFVLQVDGKRVPQDQIPVFEETCAELSSTAVAQEHPPAGMNESVAAEPADLMGLVLYFDFTQLSYAGCSNALALTRAWIEGPYDGTTEVMIQANARRGFEGFTTDRVLLARALVGLKNDCTPVKPGASNGPQAGVTPLPDRPTCLDWARPLAFVEWARARASLDELKHVVDDLTGRKKRLKLVLMSDLLHLEPGAQYLAACNTTPASQGINLRASLEELFSAAERSGISIYTVHAGGLEAHRVGVNEPGMRGNFMEWVPEQIAIDSAHGLQATVAAQTGGRALRHSNDVAAIVESARRDLSCYYMLGYAPPNPPDGLRHTLAVTVEKSPSRKLPAIVNVRHRPFFIDRIP